MGASNFAYDNRCVVVTDSDFEANNLPDLGEWCSDKYGRSYPAREVITKRDFEFHRIVLRAGYYEAACIDWVLKDSAEERYDDWYYYSRGNDTLEQLYRKLRSDYKDFGISISLIRKLASGIKHKHSINNDDYVGQIVKAVIDWAIEQERTVVETTINEIRDEYGYEEYRCVAVTNNGEGSYRKIG